MAVSTKTVVQQFLVMLGQPEDTVSEFMEKISGPYDKAYFDGLYASLPVMTGEKNVGKITTKIAGSYGKLFFCGIDGKRCYKYIELSPDIVHDTFKELFIQYFLSKDIEKNIPALYNIYKPPSGPNTIIIEMEKLDKNLYEIFMDMSYRSKQLLSYEFFYKITKGIFILLQYLNAKYQYAHRDFKINNIMLKNLPNGDADIQLIDFGMSCITIDVDGIDYRIIGKGPYVSTAPCIIQQDVVLYLMSIYTTLGRYKLLSKEITYFMEKRMFVNDFMRYISTRVTTPNTPFTGDMFRASYNLWGNLFTNPAYVTVEEAFDVKRLLRILDEVATAIGIPIFPPPAASGGSAGGRRRRRHTKTRRNKKQ